MRTATITMMAATLLIGGGCAGTSFEVVAPAKSPQEAGVRRSEHARVRARVQVPNFHVAELDTRHSPDDQARARAHFAVAIPNMVQQALVDQRLFTEVARVEKADRATADFVLTGVLNSIVDQEGGESVVFYQTNLELINVETNEKVWIGDHKIKKFIEKSKFKL